jgi:hypothetical protein
MEVRIPGSMSEGTAPPLKTLQPVRSRTSNPAEEKDGRHRINKRPPGANASESTQNP